MPDISTELELIWDYEKCILWNYRVEGVCVSIPNSTYPFYMPPTGQLYNESALFVINIAACNVEDVCRRLKKFGFVGRILKIEKFANPTLNIGNRITPDYLTDVTPSLDSCDECCKFLVDEDLEQLIGFVGYFNQAFDYSSSGSVTVSGDGDLISNYQFSGSGSVIVSGNSDIITHYIYISCGEMIVEGNSNIQCSRYVYEGNGIIDVSGESYSHAGNMDYYLYSGSGDILISGEASIGWLAQPEGTIVLSGSSDAYWRVVYESSGDVVVGASIEVISPNYYWQSSGEIILTGESDCQCSNVGTLEELIGTLEEVEVGSIFGYTTATVIQSATSFIDTSCCSAAIPDTISLTHNLGEIRLLKNFLLMNDFTLPSTLLLTYNRRYQSWQNTIHLTGKSPESGGDTSWDLIFEWSCTEIQSSFDSKSWNLSILLKNQVGNIRLLTSFESTKICTGNRGFTGVNIIYNTKTKTLTPTGRALFYDESNLSITELKINLTIAVPTTPQLLDYSLELQRTSTLTVGV